MIEFIAVIGVGVLVHYLWQSFKGKKAQNKQNDQFRSAALWCAEQIKSGSQIKFICGTPTNLALADGEELLCNLPGTTLMEPRAIRISRGCYAGPSIRIAKGVSFHFGSSQSISESHDEIRPVDSGGLAVTNRRLIFVGSNRTV